MNVTYLFPGQGSQFVGMGEDFYHSSSRTRELFERASEVLKLDMKKLLLEENDRLNKTEFSQPAILLLSAVALEMLGDKFKPNFALGHSLGEISALYGVGALEFEGAIELVHQRGLLMSKACEGKDAGMMAVIGLEYERVQNMCEDFAKEGKQIYLANINNQAQIVLAGAKKDLNLVQNILKENGAKRALLLPMSVASHCPFLLDALTPFGELLNLHVKDEFQMPIISNVTAEIYEDKKTACKLLKEQLIAPVKYVQCMEYADKNSDIFVEFGASVLKGLNKRISKKQTHSIVDMKSLEIVANL